MKMADFINTAITVCRGTFGCSKNVLEVYEQNPGIFTKKLTPKNVNSLIKLENHSAIYGSGTTIQDRMAVTFVPVRYFIAHSVAYLMVTTHEGFYGDNEYSRESYLRLTESF